jgi:hypothetical protein
MNSDKLGKVEKKEKAKKKNWSAMQLIPMNMTKS